MCVLCDCTLYLHFRYIIRLHDMQHWDYCMAKIVVKGFLKLTFMNGSGSVLWVP